MSDEWITTRKAAELLGVMPSTGYNLLKDNACERRELRPQLLEWRRADVEALRELRGGPREIRANAASHRLKAMIENYWRERGYTVTVRFEESPFCNEMRSARIDIRSDMVDGWPTK